MDKTITGKQNLWNMGEGKTKQTLLYLRSLEPDQSWTKNQLSSFQNKLEKAMLMTTANEMLETIGYRVDMYPQIYEKIMEMS